MTRSAPIFLASSWRKGITSLTSTREAPAALQTGMAAMPMGPPPRMRNVLPTVAPGHDRVHGVAEGVVDGRAFGVDPLGHAPQVGLGHGDVVGEAAVAVHAQDDHVLAEVGVAGAALEALVADHVHLGGHQVAHLVMADIGAGLRRSRRRTRGPVVTGGFSRFCDHSSHL